MLGFDRGGDLGVGLDIALVGLLDRARLHRGRVLVDRPARAVMGQFELDHAQVLAPVVRHYRRHAVDQPLGLVDARQVELRHGAVGVGEDLVRMPDQHRIDAGHLGQMPARVLHVGRIRRRIEAAMRDHHHQVGALGAHFRDVLLGGFPGADRVDLAVEPALVPGHDRRRREADDADLDGHRHGLAVGRRGAQLPRDDRVGLEQRPLRLDAVDVGQHLRKRRAGASGLRRRLGQPVDVEAVAGDLVQERQAVVELVIADAAAIKPGCVHHLVHRQRIAARQRADLRLVIGQCGALDRVAVVQQHRVGEFGARLLDQRRDALEAHGLVFGQLEIVVAAHVAVQIGGLQQGQRGPGARRDRGRRRRARTGIARAVVIGTAGSQHGNRRQGRQPGQPGLE